LKTDRKKKRLRESAFVSPFWEAPRRRVRWRTPLSARLTRFRPKAPAVMAEQSSIQVVVRLRPMSERELKGNALPVVTASTEKKEVTVIKGSGARTLRSTFAFDDVFTSFSTQKEVFDQTLAPVIGDVLQGYESTVFAYGQTGTGKTHTMEGDLSVAEERGVIPRAAFDVFRRLRADDSYVEVDVRASFLEIYNEELCDLLVDCDFEDVALVKAKSKELRLVEDPGSNKKKGKGVFVMGLTEERVSGPEDVLSLMARASERRKVGETKMNKQSSRSHCVFTMSVRTRKALPDGSHMECAGKLHMVDLAGSECAKSAGGPSGSDLDGEKRERERKNINQSLLTLGRVITLLKNGGKAKGERIPYRDSKLTRLLQESLGGRCKTCVIATVSPSAMSADETLSTLQYAQSAHGIVNKPVAQSMLKLNVEGAGRPSTARGDEARNGHMTGQTQQDWAEMECRMHYLETQAEEAAAALARKHAEHAALVHRAETAEGKVEAAEKHAGLAEAARAETLERLEEKNAENDRLRALLAARKLTETKLTAEAKALLAALDAFTNAAARKTKALEAEATAEAEKRKKARAFGVSAAASVSSLAASVDETSAELTAAHAAARAALKRAAEAATAGAEDAAARIAAAADAATASAAEMALSAAADADGAAKRREKLSAKLSAAAKAASEAARQNARNAAKAADAVLAAFAVGESALESWSAAAEKATLDAAAEVDALAAEHDRGVVAGGADVTASVDEASASLAEQRALLDAAAGRLAAFAAAAAARENDLDARADASRVSASAAAEALGASAAALEAAKAAHDAERAALAEFAAEITARVQRSSAAAAAASAAAESAREEATNAMDIVTRDASAAAAGFAALKRGASEALGESAEAAETVSKAARLAEAMATAHDTARSRSKTMAESVASAGAALASAAKSAFEATRGSVAALVSSRPTVTSSARAASETLKRDVDALAADAGATVDAVVGAVAKAAEKEKAFAAEAETRAAKESAAASAALRAATEAARDAVAAAADSVSGHLDATAAGVADAETRHASGSERAAKTRDALGSAIEKHVLEVDQAEIPVPPVDPLVAPAFSKALASTPPDDVVLNVAVPSRPGAEKSFSPDGGDSRGDSATEGDEAPAEGNEDKNVAGVKSTDDAENVVPARATKTVSSVAAMRARKFAGSAKPARPALREVNQ